MNNFHGEDLSKENEFPKLHVIGLGGFHVNKQDSMQSVEGTGGEQKEDKEEGSISYI